VSMVARLKDIAAAAAAVAEEAMCFPFCLLAGTVYHVSYPTNSALPALLFPVAFSALSSLFFDPVLSTIVHFTTKPLARSTTYFVGLC